MSFSHKEDCVNKEELTNIFKEIGADDPESWAASEIDEGIPQLARFMFLKGAWNGVVPDNEEWIDNVMGQYDEEDDSPYSGMGHSIKKMLDFGVPRQAITELSRCIAAEMIFHIGYMLDDPESIPGNEHVNWALVQLDEEGNAKNKISGLHESVLETDPTGREMCPRE